MARNYNKFDPDKLRKKLDETDWSLIFEQIDVDLAWNMLVEKFAKLLDEHVP